MLQIEALEIMKQGHNIFLTGPAGSGKTYILNKYIKEAKKKGKIVAKTASTGIASTHLGGSTIHSWSGIGIKKELTEDQIAKIFNNKFLREKIEKTDILVIDEVSMLHDFQLDMVDTICRRIRRTGTRPFGGLQIILCGDFFQLPPVSKTGEANFVTESEVWNSENFDLKICYLEEQYRQEDEKFLNILNAIRDSKTTDTTIFEPLLERINATIDSEVKPVKLFTHNADVDAINRRKLAEIDAPERLFKMTSSGIEWMVDKLKEQCLAPEFLRLKVGATVMFVKNNFNKGYVNGTMGTVIRFENDKPVVKTYKGQIIVPDYGNWEYEEKNIKKAVITQIPLRLAWAITVHKSQGMSLDSAEIDLSKAFDYGMGYVALSRVRSLSGMILRGINDVSFEVNPEVVIMDKFLRKKSEMDKEALLKDIRFIETTPESDRDYPYSEEVTFKDLRRLT